jgi:hypothetical protein
MKKLIFLIVIALIASSCMSIRYPWKNQQQEVLYEFIEYLYSNRNDDKFNEITSYKNISINFIVDWNSMKNLQEFLQNYSDGILYCNKNRFYSNHTLKNEISFKNIVIYYKLLDSKDYISFFFKSDKNENQYILTSYSIYKNRESCQGKDIQDIPGLPPHMYNY